MEIERKYLVRSLPHDLLEGCQSAEISQAYLDFGDGNEPERRIRKLIKGDEIKFFYTEKSKGELCREEEEYEIPEYSFNNLSELVISAVIQKKRYYLPLSETLTAELDVYGGKLEGLIAAEVEFPTLKDAEAFIPPEWFGEEITYDPKYKNKNLAQL